ncbi:MAG: hypothetical protein Q4F15_05195 [Bacillota bacterium]|nr:hypothetical protein [Bacillota bacterium]
MYYTESEKIDIGKKIFLRKITKKEAKEQFRLSDYEANACVRAYMKSEGIPPVPVVEDAKGIELPDYASMTKGELIAEIMRKDIEVARAKKGYTAKGGGRTKEFRPIKD